MKIFDAISSEIYRNHIDMGHWPSMIYVSWRNYSLLKKELAEIRSPKMDVLIRGVLTRPADTLSDTAVCFVNKEGHIVFRKINAQDPDGDKAS